jgi:ketosteroid isomerase-like protein
VTSSVPTPVEIFEQVLRAAQSGEVQAMLDLCADDVVFEFPFAPPGRPAEVRGKEPLGRYLAAVPSRIQFDGLSNLETHQTVYPDVAVIEMTATGKVRDTGEPYDQSYVVVLTAREGRITRYRDYWNPLKALQAASQGEQ